MSNVSQIRAHQPDSSTVELELEALDKELRTINIELIHMEQWEDEAGRLNAIEAARRALNNAVIISSRAERINRGIRVNILR